jgi:hypothetical protein
MDSNNDLLHHALDWLWAVVAGVFIIISGAIVRLWRHEERIKTLEEHHLQKINVLSDLSSKVDRNHSEITARLDLGLGEIRDDIRVLTTRCLSFTHQK